MIKLNVGGGSRWEKEGWKVLDYRAENSKKYIKGYDGVIALGCIIKGETNNFELISQSVTDAIINLSIKHKKPIGNGIITCFDGKQAEARKKKGAEAAAAVVNFFNGRKPLKLD